MLRYAQHDTNGIFRLATQSHAERWGFEHFERLLSGCFFFLIQNRTVFRRTALPARPRAKTAAVELTVFESELDIHILRGIAEYIDRVLSGANFFQLLLQLATIEKDAFIRKSQGFLGPIRHSALGNPRDHVFAAVVIEQPPL